MRTDAEEICRGIVDNDSMNSSVQAAASRAQGTAKNGLTMEYNET